jgi:hypothetical protein
MARRCTTSKEDGERLPFPSRYQQTYVVRGDGTVGEP